MDLDENLTRTSSLNVELKTRISLSASFNGQSCMVRIVPKRSQRIMMPMAWTIRRWSLPSVLVMIYRQLQAALYLDNSCNKSKWQAGDRSHLVAETYCVNFQIERRIVEGWRFGVRIVRLNFCCSRSNFCMVWLNYTAKWRRWKLLQRWIQHCSRLASMSLCNFLYKNRYKSEIAIMRIYELPRVCLYTPELLRGDTDTMWIL